MDKNILLKKESFLKGESSDLEGFVLEEVFDNEFISYILSTKQRWSGIRDDICEIFKIENLTKKTFGSYEINLFNALIHIGVDISDIFEQMNDEQKSQIGDLSKQLLKNKKIQVPALARIMDRKSLADYVEQNEEQFTDFTIIRFIERNKIDRIPTRILDVLIRDRDFQFCEEISKRYNLGESFLNKKIEYDKEKTIRTEKSEIIKKIEKEGIDNITDDEIKVLIEDSSSLKFYQLAEKFNFKQELINKRQEFNRNIIDNPNNYSRDTVLEAFSDLYFKNQNYNILLDLESIINFGESEESFKGTIQNFDEIKKLRDFLADGISYDNPEQFIEMIQYFKAQCQHLNLEKIKEIQDISIQTFGNNLSKQLEDSLSKITDGIEAENIEGTNVKMYRIENQTENQQEFTLLIHSEGIERARKYFETNKYTNKMSFSVLDEKHFQTYSGEIIFGYNGLKGKNIHTVNTMDGNTDAYLHSEYDKNTKAMPNQLYSINDFMDRTAIDRYNEITITANEGESERIDPDYIVTYNEKPTEEEIEIAQRFGLPIFYINKEVYLEKVSEQDKKKGDNQRITYKYNDYLRTIKETPELSRSENTTVSTTVLGKETLEEQNDTTSKDETENAMDSQIKSINRDGQTNEII